MLDQNGFNFTTLVGSNSTTNPLPEQILIGGRCFGSNLNIILYQVTDVRSKVKNKVWLGDNSGGFSGANTSRTVRS